MALTDQYLCFPELHVVTSGGKALGRWAGHQGAALRNGTSSGELFTTEFEEWSAVCTQEEDPHQNPNLGLPASHQCAVLGQSSSAMGFSVIPQHLQLHKGQACGRRAQMRGPCGSNHLLQPVLFAVAFSPISHLACHYARPVFP